LHQRLSVPSPALASYELHGMGSAWHKEPDALSTGSPGMAPPDTGCRAQELHGVFLTRSGRRSKRLEEYLASIRNPNRYGYQPIGLEWDLW
jgi:hypothetical protein